MRTGVGATPLGMQISRLLADPSELQQFIQWFKSALWEAESGRDPDILSLARRVENLLYSYLDGDWTADVFLQVLQREAATFGISPAQAIVRIVEPTVSSDAIRASMPPALAWANFSRPHASAPES